MSTINKEAHAVGNDFGQLGKDAQALLAATADVAGDKVKEARERLTAALERAKEAGNGLAHKCAAGAKIADEAIHKNPYPAIAAGIGLGALVGLLLARR